MMQMWHDDTDWIIADGRDDIDAAYKVATGETLASMVGESDLAEALGGFEPLPDDAEFRFVLLGGRHAYPWATEANGFRFEPEGDGLEAAVGPARAFVDHCGRGFWATTEF